MKHIKLFFWVIIIGFLVLLIFQNQEFFFTKTPLNMDFYFNENKYPIPPVPNVLLFLAFFFTGLLIAYIISLFGQFKAKKTLKNLNLTLQSQMEVISGLRSELAAKNTQIEQLQAQTTATPPPEVEKETETDAVAGPTEPLNEAAPEKNDPAAEEEKKVF